MQGKGKGLFGWQKKKGNYNCFEHCLEIILFHKQKSVQYITSDLLPYANEELKSKKVKLLDQVQISK